MTVVVCIDDRGGMLFGGRRQSRDRNLTADLIMTAQAEGARLLAAPFSERIFEKFDTRPILSENFLDEAAAEDICFVENKALAPYFDKIHRLILYRWNRAYPGDTHLDLDPASLRLVSSEDFAGHSHEKITKEIYIK